MRNENMNNKDAVNYFLVEDNAHPPVVHDAAILNKEKFLEVLKEDSYISDLATLRKEIGTLTNLIVFPRSDSKGLLNIDSGGDTVSVRKSLLISQLEQIEQAQTLGRAKYYLSRLEKGIKESKTSKISDINLLRWQEYDDIITDSLWILDRRDNSGAHLGWYWGNFIPQIPHL